MNKLIEFWDPIAGEWRECRFIGYTSFDATVIEVVNNGVVLLPEGTARLRDIGAN